MWIEQSNNIHFFVNIDNKLVWEEYQNDKVIQKYTLFKYIRTDLILSNQDKFESYTKLTKTDYSIGSLDSLSDPTIEKISGSWLIEPMFPNGKFISIK